MFVFTIPFKWLAIMMLFIVFVSVMLYIFDEPPTSEEINTRKQKEKIRKLKAELPSAVVDINSITGSIKPNKQRIHAIQDHLAQIKNKGFSDIVKNLHQEEFDLQNKVKRLYSDLAMKCERLKLINKYIDELARKNYAVTKLLSSNCL